MIDARGSKCPGSHNESAVELQRPCEDTESTLQECGIKEGSCSCDELAWLICQAGMCIR